MGRARRKRRRYSKEYVRTASGVAWYQRDQWERLRQVVADPEALEDSYEEWVSVVEHGIRELEAKGMLIERVPVDVEELIDWCNEQGRPIDGSARAAFAAHVLRRMT